MSEEVEFYAPWRVTKPYKAGAPWVIWDDNGNPMAYSEDSHFLEEAVRRINVHEDLLLACDLVKGWIEHENIKVGPVVWAELCRALARAKGEA
jgi:hypothetical protein